MPPLDRQSILNARDREIVSVDVPEWGGSVCLRAMSGIEREEYERYVKDNPNMERFRARLLVLTIVDEHGNRLFADDDVEALSQKSAAALERLFYRALEINRMGAAAEEAAKKV